MLEQELIQEILDIFPESKGLIGDDAAVLKLAANNYVFSQDNFIEGIHFSRKLFSPADIGWKALAVNISDMAAMAAEPLYFSLGLSLARDISDKKSWVRSFASAMKDCALKFGHPKLIGGDLSSAKSESTCISISIMGKPYASNKIPFRSNAKKGYRIGVSGKFGNSKSYFDNGASEDPNHADNPKYHLRPEPRLELAQKLSEANVNFALMDASDGLAQALIEIAQKSNVLINIDSANIPRDSHISLNDALYGGEDYELVTAAAYLPEGYTEIGFCSDIITSSGVNMKHPLLPDQSLTNNKIYKHF